MVRMRGYGRDESFFCLTKNLRYCLVITVGNEVKRARIHCEKNGFLRPIADHLSATPSRRGIARVARLTLLTLCTQKGNPVCLNGEINAFFGPGRQEHDQHVVQESTTSRAFQSILG